MGPSLPCPGKAVAAAASRAEAVQTEPSVVVVAAAAVAGVVSHEAVGTGSHTAEDRVQTRHNNNVIRRRLNVLMVSCVFQEGAGGGIKSALSVHRSSSRCYHSFTNFS